MDGEPAARSHHTRPPFGAQPVLGGMRRAGIRRVSVGRARGGRRGGPRPDSQLARRQPGRDSRPCQGDRASQVRLLRRPRHRSRRRYLSFRRNRVLWSHIPASRGCPARCVSSRLSGNLSRDACDQRFPDVAVWVWGDRVAPGAGGRGNESRRRRIGRNRRPRDRQALRRRRDRWDWRSGRRFRRVGHRKRPRALSGPAR
jgi:hypothetical protein